MIKNSWFAVQEIDSKTFAISEHGDQESTHSFLLLGDTKAVLIGTGQGIANIKKVTDQLTDLPICVLTPNVHYNHIGSHDEFDQVYIHKQDADWLANGVQGLSLEQIRKEISRNLVRRAPDTFDLCSYKPYRGEATGFIEDGDVIDLGNRQLKIYHTPVHTPGQICIFDSTNGYLFIGDILYNGAPISPFDPNVCPADLVKSLKRLFAIKDVSMVYGSHNTLGMHIEMFKETKLAIQYLEENKLVESGSGFHVFDTISFLF